jgi:hypothetical protein
MSMSYISSPPWRLRGGSGAALLYFSILTCASLSDDSQATVYPKINCSSVRVHYVLHALRNFATVPEECLFSSSLRKILLNLYKFPKI